MQVFQNQPGHHSTGGYHARKVGAWVLFLPPYSPDLNPVEMAFPELRGRLRRTAVRTCNNLWRAVGHVCDLFTEQACHNFFKATGCETN
ncbi:transposase [Roseovarius pacificus]|uniref:transposase n=1 Tax=Roseovarius pacificus TaxID=337701 RepID=UPI000A017693